MKRSTKLPAGRFAARRAALHMCLIGLLTLALAPAAQADGPAFLVKDINTQVVERPMPDPSALFRVGDQIFILVQDSWGHRDLWKTDGTAPGTRLVKDMPDWIHIYDDGMADVNGTLFFTVSDSNEIQIGGELWKSDGTAEGTAPLKDVMAGWLTNVRGTLFFAGNDMVSGWGLWKSDGTEAGTVRIPLSGGYSGPSSLINVNGTLFFAASSSSGTALWKSDGTVSGTILIKKIIFGGLLATVNGALFFSADDGHSGQELWKSDGTAAGTVKVKDINPGAGDAFQFPVPTTGVKRTANIDGTLFFVATDGHSGYELWKSDGSTAGTIPVKDINPGAANSDPADLTNMNGTLFFSALDASGVRTLWKSDGTAAGTVRVKYVTPEGLVNLNGMLLFDGYTPDSGAELWKSDGTSTGTVAIQPVTSGTASSSPTWLTEMNGALFFAATDGANGMGLWRSDGTTAGTIRILTNGPCVYPSELTNINGTLFFAAGAALCKSDGTAAGTALVKQITVNNGSSPRLSHLTNVNGLLYFLVASDPVSDGGEIWQSDGTAAGTIPAAEIASASTGLGYEMVDINGTLFFTTGDRNGARQLWKSDGTAAGTILIASFMSQLGRFPPSSLLNLTSLNGVLFFAGYDSDTGYELWKSDGTWPGTVRIKDINPGMGSSAPANLINVGGTLFFGASDGSSGRELWKSDGTTVGTAQVADLTPGKRGSHPDSLTNVNGRLFFAANDGRLLRKLWKSDGTAAGTILVTDIAPEANISDPAWFTLAGNYLFFSADDGNTGQELWAIRAGVDAYLQAPVLAGAAPGGAAGIPIRYGNLGLTRADALTLTATLDPALSYLGDSSGITPTISGKTVSWRLPPVDFNGQGAFTVWVHAPVASFGTRYAIAMTLTTASETHPPDNIAQVEVMIAHQVYLPVVHI